MRDILARWSAEPGDAGAPPLPVVYVDNVFSALLDAFELLGVVASESMQPQSAAAVFHALAIMFDRLPERWQARAEDLILRLLSALGALVRALTAAARFGTAAAVEEARAGLGASVGKLNSRSTRATAARDGP